jgi:hypothetical protein
MIKNIVIGLCVCILVFTGILLISPIATPDAFPFYSIKRIEEKIGGLFQRSVDQKIRYNIFLLNRRLSDLKYITDNREYALYYQSSLRYAATAGTLANLITIKYQANDVLNIFNSHSKTLVNILRLKNDDESWKFIYDNINYLQIYSKQIKKIKK